MGIDIVKIARFEEHAANPHAPFPQKTYTPRELEYLKNKKAQSYAGIFAAKEAVAKAIGTGFRGFMPRDIEILHNSKGKPYPVLHNGAKKAAKRAHGRFARFQISISHTDTDAAATAYIANPRTARA